MDKECNSANQLDGCIKSKMSEPVAIENQRFSSSEEHYDTTNKYRGLALVFNHENFELEDKRDGTKKDRKDIERALIELKFSVFVYDDLSKAEVLKTLKMWSQEKFWDCDCLVVVMMTHGGNNFLYARDACYPVESLWANFVGDKCPSLIGKPKMFFIQACRGKAFDEGVEFNPKSSGNDRMDCTKNEEPNSCPSMADLLMMYSTYEGHISWRDTDNGSWFIQSLCEELKENGNVRDLLTLLTGVARRTAYEYQSCHKNEKFDSRKQMPCVVSKLTKTFYFTEKTESKPFKMNVNEKYYHVEN